ncbi:MAG: VCBS repeat-containing protein [Deltaproteobacteria bacterium]|nr:VCBS repeat-containing protein [Deltaproteobacteria bacterium]
MNTKTNNVISTLMLSILFAGLSSCQVGTLYEFREEGEECGRGKRCASGLQCVEGICESIVDAGTDVEDGDIEDTEDITDIQDGDIEDGDITDADVDADADAGTCLPEETPCGQNCCTDEQLCFEGECVDSHGDCTSDMECPGDTYCYDNSVCIPYGTGPRDTHNPLCGHFAVAGLFQPVLQCAWDAPPPGDPYPNHVNVLSTPLVVDFDFDDDLSTSHPSVVFVTYNGTDGSSGYYNGAYGVIRVIDGATCEQQFNVGTQLNGCNTPAIGDLDGDARPEIIAHNGLGGIEAFTYDATSTTFVQMFHGHNASGTNLTYGAQSTGWAGVAVHDINDDGYPEILSKGYVYDHTGLQISTNLGFSGPFYPTVADLDSNGVVDMASGAALYSYDAASDQWITEWTGGPSGYYVAYGDFGYFPPNAQNDDRKFKDGIAEIVVVGSGSGSILNIHGRTVFGPFSFPAGSGGGPPTVGDFDGDGRAEFSAASSDSISVFDFDCLGIPDVSTCLSLRSDGVLWHQVSQDHSSNRTGSSLFDFEGDGRVEVVYADEAFTRVYDGRTGEVLFSQWHSSCTWNENPIVADVDGDFNAELVVPSNYNCSITPTTAGGIPYPASHQGYPMDPLFRGFRCEEDGDCLSQNCADGYCRCAEDSECGTVDSGWVCDVPVAGTPGSGNVCRSQWLGQYPGVKVYGDSLDRWVASRTIWNQHSYSVTNVSESGTIPQLSAWPQNWLDSSLNNFRQNVQGEIESGTSPDLTLRTITFDCNSFSEAEFTLEVCNRGTQPVTSGVPVSVSTSDGSDLLCQGYTSSVMVPGQCENVLCVWDSPPATPGSAALVVGKADDEDGSSVLECIENNNRLLLSDIYCEIIGK